jgi:hypothetical protein
MPSLGLCWLSDVWKWALRDFFGVSAGSASTAGIAAVAGASHHYHHVPITTLSYL